MNPKNLKVFLWVATVFLVQLVIFQKSLIFATNTLDHDNYYWYLPIYSSLLDALKVNQIPFWNFYSHSGENFLTALFQDRVLDLHTIIVGKILSFFNVNEFYFLNWDRFLKTFLAGLGILILLKRFCKNELVFIFLLPVCFFNSTLINSFVQPGTIDQFYFVPYLLYFYFNIVDEEKLKYSNVIGFFVLIGYSFQSYFFTGTLILLMSIFLGMVIFHKSLAIKLFKQLNFKLLAIVLIVLIASAMPTIVYIVQVSKDLVFPARFIPKDFFDNVANFGPLQNIQFWNATILESLTLPYKILFATGTFQTIPNLLSAVAGKEFFPNSIEGFVSIGQLPFLIALIGIIWSKHKYNSLFIFLICIFLLFSLGPFGPIHFSIVKVLPILSSLRHTHLLTNFLVLFLLYFYVQGLNTILPDFKKITIRKNLASIFSFSLLVILSILVFSNFLKQFQSELFLGLFAGLILVNRYEGYFRKDIVAKLPNTSRKFLCTTIILIIAVFYLRAIDAAQLNKLEHEYLYLYFLALALVIVLFRKNIYSPIFLVLMLAPFFFLDDRQQIISYLVNLLSISGMLIILIFSRKPLLLLIPFLYITSANIDNVIKYSKFNIDTPYIVKSDMDGKRSLGLGSEYYNLSKNIENNCQIGFQPIRYNEILFNKLVAYDPPYLSIGSIYSAHELFDYYHMYGMWNSYSMPKKYYELISSQINEKSINEILAINKNIIQFKSGVIVTDRFIDDIQTKYTQDDLKNNIFIRSDQLEKINKSYSLNNLVDFDIDDFKFTPNSIAFRISSRYPGFVYVADGYDSHWRAEINGKPSDLIIANHAFKAVQVQSGVSEVRLTYDLFLFKFSLILQYCIYLIFLIYFFVTIAKKVHED